MITASTGLIDEDYTIDINNQIISTMGETMTQNSLSQTFVYDKLENSFYTKSVNTTTLGEDSTSSTNECWIMPRSEEVLAYEKSYTSAGNDNQYEVTLVSPDHAYHYTDDIIKNYVDLITQASDVESLKVNIANLISLDSSKINAKFTTKNNVHKLVMSLDESATDVLTVEILYTDSSLQSINITKDTIVGEDTNSIIFSFTISKTYQADKYGSFTRFEFLSEITREYDVLYDLVINGAIKRNINVSYDDALIYSIEEGFNSANLGAKSPKLSLPAVCFFIIFSPFIDN